MNIQRSQAWLNRVLSGDDAALEELMIGLFGSIVLICAVCG